MNQLQPAIDRVLTLAAAQGWVNPAELERYADRLAAAAETATESGHGMELATMAYLHRAAAVQARAARPPRAHWWSRRG